MSTTTLRLPEDLKTRIERLSGGQRKRVSIGVELLTKPELLFLDEPTAGLDPALEEQFMDLCRNLARQGRTVLMTTHVMQSLDRLDQVAIMSAGRPMTPMPIMARWRMPPENSCGY